MIETPETDERRTDRRACPHCEASAADCRSHKWLSGRLCCQQCRGDHDDGGEG